MQKNNKTTTPRSDSNISKSEIASEIVGNALIIKISGDIDHHMSERVRAKIDNELNKHGLKNIVLDFSEVNFMDSSGIGMILGRYKFADKLGGKLSVASMNQSLRRVFDMSGLYKIVKLYDCVNDALT